MDKNRIVQELRTKIEKLKIPQAEVARRVGVSPATITNVLAEKWDNISNAWKKIEAFVSESLSGWQAAETDNYKFVRGVCREAQAEQVTRAISWHAGSGKTYAARNFAANHQNVFYVCALGDMSKRDLLLAFCKVMGIPTSYRSSDMLQDILDKLRTLQNPLLIVDEFDELKDSAMRVFKDIYNTIQCGFVIIGGENLRIRITKGCNKSKQSFQEIFSRLGREFLDLSPIDAPTITKVCEAQGIKDASTIKSIIRDTQGDLRRVEALIKSMQP